MVIVIFKLHKWIITHKNKINRKTFYINVRKLMKKNNQQLFFKYNVTTGVQSCITQNNKQGRVFIDK